MYIKITDKKGSSKTSILTGKSRVAPQATIPRLELSAAVIGARMYQKIIDELSLTDVTPYFWTDSMCVLRYIQNTRSAFKIFVANRLEIIHDITDANRWFYIPTKLNPADATSRGIMPNEIDKIKTFLKGPDFLCNDTYPNFEKPTQPESEEEINEIKSADVLVGATQKESESLLHRLGERYSSYDKLKRAAVFLRKFVYFATKRKFCKDFTGEDLKESTTALIADHQTRYFKREVEMIKAGGIRPSSRLRNLGPYIDDVGLLRVSGRLQHSSLTETAKHPVILDPKDQLVSMIVDDVHKKNGHVGAQHTLHRLRQEYWILHGLAAVKSGF